MEDMVFTPVHKRMSTSGVMIVDEKMQNLL